MKDEYQDRLQRAKNKLNEERARKASEMRDDASFTSAMSHTSRKSYTSEYSHASSKQEKGPRSEWRNKANAVIERGKTRKEEAAEILLRDDVSVRSRGSHRSSKDREDDIDSLVERNALLNEREKMLKVENDLLDAAETEDWHENVEGDDRSFESNNKSSATLHTTDSRTKQCGTSLNDGLNRSFHETKAAWQIRCKNEPGKPNVDDPTPIRSNITFNNDDESQATNKQTELLSLARSFSFHKRAPGSPDSVKSSRSFRSSRSAKSEYVLSKYSKSKKYSSSAPASPESTSAKSERIPRVNTNFGDTTPSHQSLTSSTSRGEARAREDSNHYGSSASVSSNYSKLSKYSARDEEAAQFVEDLESMFPSELSIPILTQTVKNGENQKSMRRTRELSYRERSALIASMDKASVTNANGAVEEVAPERSMFHQRSQIAKQKKIQPIVQSSVPGITLGEKRNISTITAAGPAALGEKRGFNNVADTTKMLSNHTKTIHKDKSMKQQEGVESIQMSNLLNDNKELKARLEKERTSRSELDEKAAHLQLEVHQQTAEIEALRRRKDVSASHKEQIYKMEDALQETNQHLHVVIDENAKLQESVEEERARRSRTDNHCKHIMMKLKKKSDEVVALALELKRREDTYTEALVQEEHLREVAETQLAKACFHINKSEKERGEELDEIENENNALRHGLHRMEQFIKQQMVSNSNSGMTPRMRRQSGASLQPHQEEGISNKPSWGGKSAISEMTTDFDFNELNNSQTGEI